MNKFLLFLFLSAFTFVFANLPPTTSKINGDTTKKTTFDFEFPNFTGTRVGTKTTISGANNLPVSGDITLTGPQFGNAEVGSEILTLQSTGLYSGGFLSVNVGNNALFDVSAVEAVIIDSTSLYIMATWVNVDNGNCLTVTVKGLIYISLYCICVS